MTMKRMIIGNPKMKSIIEFTSSICPLTYLENWLLIQDNASFYDGGFIEHYIMRIVYPEGINSNIQMILGFVLIILNILLYALIYYLKFFKKKS